MEEYKLFEEQEQDDHDTNRPIIETNDLFFQNVYRYYTNNGFWNIVLGHILKIFKLLFFLFFTKFLFTYYREIFFGNPLKINLNNILHFNFIQIVYIIIYCTYILWNILTTVVDIICMKDISNYYNNGLGVSDDVLKYTSWKEIVYIIESKEQNSIIDITQKIMRKHNFMIGLLSDDDILLYNLPKWISKKLLYSTPFVWNIQYNIIMFLFDKNSQINQKIILNDPNVYQELKYRIIITSIIQIIFMPFIFVYLILYYIFKYGVIFYKTPSKLSQMEWNLHAFWSLRSYNDLDHLYRSRLHHGQQNAISFLYTIRNTCINQIAKFVTFISGSILFVLLFITFTNENHTEVLFYIGIFGTIFALSKSFIIKHVDEEDTMKHLNALGTQIPTFYKYIHQDNAYFSDIHEYLNEYFEYQIVIILKDIIGIVITPFIMLHYSRYTFEIITFLRNNCKETKNGYIFSDSDFTNYEYVYENQTNNNVKLHNSIVQFNTSYEISA